MSFYLKKFLSFFLDPFSIVFIFSFLAFIFLLFNSYKKAKVFLLLSLLFLFLFSSSIVSNFLIDPLEQQYINQKSVKYQNVEYVLLLGGDFKLRSYGVLKLYKEYGNLKIITSGYKGKKKISDALFAKNELIKLGIDENNILLQEEPKDTIEEARKVKEIVKSKPFFLVTSAYHMPRAMMIFKSHNLNPIAISTAFEVEELSSNKYLNLKEFKKSNMAVHEYIGILWLKIKSIID